MLDNNKPPQIRKLYHFGAFRLDAAEQRLWCEDEPIPLTPKQFELLTYFVENAGHVAKKDELLSAVWADSYVEESTLARNVSWLRKKLEEYSNGELLIETVPKRGYLFTAEVTLSDNDEDVLIVEEQTVQYFRGEETITIDEAVIGKIGEKEYQYLGRENPNSLPQHAPLPLPRAFFTLIILLVALGVVVLIGSSFVKYTKNPEPTEQTASLNVNSKKTIKNITVDASLEVVDTEITVQPGDIIDISAEGEYKDETGQTFSYEGDKTTKPLPDHTFQNADPWSLVGWIGTQTDKNDYFQVSKNSSVMVDRSGLLCFAVNNRKQKNPDTRGGFVISVTLTRAALSATAPIKIGSIVNLKNQYSSEAGYLDAWGSIKDKPEFSFVPSELMFVSTHQNPNRDNGSGSWEIVSATGKKDGETLVYGDKLHLKNMHPGAGFLDNCGWLKDMPVFKDIVKAEKFAVFTTHSEVRDNGTGTWIVSSNSKFDGGPVLEGASISLVNGFSGSGFLDTYGPVNSILAFNQYDGSLLVFIHESTSNRRPPSGTWTISSSKVVLK